MTRTLIPSRRGMLKGGGALIVSLPIANHIGLAQACTEAAALRTIDRSARIAGEPTGGASAAVTTRNAKVVSATYQFAARDRDASGRRPMLTDLRASVDSTGSITTWDSESFVPSNNRIENPQIAYHVPNARAVCHQVDMPSYRASWVAAPDRMQHAYAHECFMDELAHAAGIEPVEFRLRHLAPGERGIDVLRHLVALSGWTERRSAVRDVNSAIATGRGMSLVNDDAGRGTVGAVCEVSVNRHTGAIDLSRVHVALARGGTSGVILATIEQLGDAADERLRHAGYPAAATALLPAVSNAIFDATGARLRSAPITPSKVKAALQGAA